MLRILKAAWTHRHRLGDQRRSALTLEFLPAALEIRERPPHPGNRVTAWLLMGLFASGLLWACLGQVDIVATAEGKLVPSGQVKLIQPYERGVVSRIHISEGQQVRRGDALVDLDNTLTGADESRLSQDLLQSQLGIVRLKAYLSSLAESGSRPAVAPPEWSHAASADQVSPHRQLLEQQVGSYRAQLAQLTRKLESKRAEQAINHAKIARLTRTLPLITQRTQALESLSERQLVARVSYLELEQNRIEQQYELSAAKARARQLDAEVEELRQQRASLVAATRGEALQQLLKLERERSALREELIKARELSRKQQLTAPVDGIVQELAVHTTGGVVSPAEVLMKIVPLDQPLMAEVWLENKDIGFVEAGQPAEIKVHTFPFTKYGVIPGTIEKLSADATADERKGLIYKASVRLSRTALDIDGRMVELVPGMGVSAEVKTGKRLLIEYITAPLLRYKSDSVEER